jgi:hypothetical protein
MDGNGAFEPNSRHEQRMRVWRQDYPWGGRKNQIEARAAQEEDFQRFPVADPKEKA